MELIDIVDENNNLTGKVADRKIIHQEGLWHRHVGAWLMNEKGELLLQKRSTKKLRNANKWSRTGGHVDAGEDPLHAVQRETKEEIGVNIPSDKWELLAINKYCKKDDNNHHFIYSFFAKVNYKIEDYTIDEEEVSDVKYVSIEEMEKIRENKDINYTFTSYNRFEEIINELKNKRQLIINNIL